MKRLIAIGLLVVGCAGGGVASSPAAVAPSLAGLPMPTEVRSAPSAITSPGPSAASTDPLAPRATPFPTPEATSSYIVGDTMAFTSGGNAGDSFFVTIKAVTPFTQQYNDPGAGMKYVTVDVLLEGVSGTNAVSAFDFTITDPDAYVYEIVGMFKEPSLPFDNDVSGTKKIRGWLTFQVPKTMKAGSVVFADTPVRFTLK